MDNGKNIVRALLGDPTEEKKAGLAFSGVTVVNVLLSFVFAVAIGLAGFTSAEEYAGKDWYLYCAYLIAPLAFAVVAGVFFVKTKTPVKRIAGGCKAKYFFIALLLQAGLFSLAQLNGLFLSFLERFGYSDPGISLPSLDGSGLFGVLFAVALLPAVFEELFFRGILLGGLKKFGIVAATLICGGLFALYHQNPAQTIYQFLCGAAFALVAVRAGSILPTVLSHFVNNALIILLARFDIESFGKATVPLTVLFVVCLAVALVWLIFFDKKKSDEPATGETQSATNAEKERRADKKGFWLCASVGIVVCALVWLTQLFTGFGG